MNYNAMRSWVAALRSGKYKQTEGVLQDSKGWCCLGVACEVAKKKKGISLRKIDNSQLYGGDLDSQVNVRHWLKTSIRGERYLISLNDNKKKSFKYIATYIEKNWRKL